MTISVVLPVYNGLKYLKQSIDSVLKQSLKDFELLICDDCSTDETYSFIQGYKDPRILLFRNDKNLGLFATLNFLCIKAQGTIIKLWSQDDIMNLQCLEEVQRFHVENPQIGFSYSDREIIDDNNKLVINNRIDNTPAIISPELHDRIAFFTGSIAGNISNVAIDKNKLEKVGWFNEKMKISADFEMWVKLSQTDPVGRIAKPLIKLRNHSGQLSRSSKYYILHLLEDKIVYEKLLERTPLENKPRALWVLKRTKYVFYFSLMIHMFYKGDFKTSKIFFKELSKMDDIKSLTYTWIKKKLLKQDILKGYHPISPRL
jgi:glycosyltransferase involved in cell wall biosynthesis